MLEKDIVVAIRRYLGTLGDDVFFWKEHGGALGTSGIPDIICCYKGRFLGLEAKLPGGRLTLWNGSRPGTAPCRSGRRSYGWSLRLRAAR